MSSTRRMTYNAIKVEEFPVLGCPSKNSCAEILTRCIYHVTVDPMIQFSH